MSEKHLSDTKFSQLPLSEDLQRGIQESGFEYCTPIQALTLPIALQKKDVTGQAQTGTGKTAAFLIATMQTLLDSQNLAAGEGAEKPEPVEAKLDEAKLMDAKPEATEPAEQIKADDESADPEAEETPKKAADANGDKTAQHNKKPRKKGLRAIIIAPTRELAIQIFEDAKPLNKHTKFNIALAYGGTDYEKQRKNIEKGADILVGTPGRIIDYFKQKVFSLNDIEVLVLDEADRMFDMGFIKDIRFLLHRMPEPAKRLNQLYSATLSERVKELAYEHMNSPTELKVESDNITADKIEEIAFMPANDEKIPLLMGLLRKNPDHKAVVFINTKHQGETIQRWLEANDFESGLLSGDVPQRKRESLLKRFKQGEAKILVATDVAARGLHIDGVDKVINFDLPQDAEDYVHRIGRTARAGASGQAISLICETYGINMMDIENYINHKIPTEQNYSDLLLTDAVVPAKQARKKTSKKKVSKKRTSRHDPERAGKPAPAPRDRKPPVNKASHSEPAASAARSSMSNSSNGTDSAQPETQSNLLLRRRASKQEVPALG